MAVLGQLICSEGQKSNPGFQQWSGSCHDPPLTGRTEMAVPRSVLEAVLAELKELQDQSQDQDASCQAAGSSGDTAPGLEGSPWGLW